MECFTAMAIPESQEGADRLNEDHQRVAEAKGKACSRWVTYTERSSYSSNSSYDF